MVELVQREEDGVAESPGGDPVPDRDATRGWAGPREVVLDELTRHLSALIDIVLAGPFDPVEATRTEVTLSDPFRRYRELLPLRTLSRCPYTGDLLRLPFDDVDLDGWYWWYDNPARPVPPAASTPSTWLVLTGAMRLGPLLREAPFTCRPGPGAPYVLPSLLRSAGVTAVLAEVPVGGHTGWAISYFQEGTAGALRARVGRAMRSVSGRSQVPRNQWGADPRVLDGTIDGRVLTGLLVGAGGLVAAGLAAPDEPVEPPGEGADVDLRPWLESGRLLWVAPGDETFTLRRGVEDCPFPGIEASPAWPSIVGGVVYEPLEAGRTLIARTMDEARLFLRGLPCERCGRLALVDGEPVDPVTALESGPVEFGQRCGGCGRMRRYALTIRDSADSADSEVGQGRGGEASGAAAEWADQVPPLLVPRVTRYGGRRPSQLLDAAQWLARFRRLVRVAMSDEGRFPDDVVVEELDLAEELLAEVVKFLPRGARAIPRSALFSQTGRRLVAFHPEDLSAFLLAENREAVRHLREQYPCSPVDAAEKDEPEPADGDVTPAPGAWPSPGEPERAKEPRQLAEHWRGGRLPRARSSKEEEEAYLALRLCEECGTGDMQWSGGASALDGHSVYLTCTNCGAEWEYRFARGHRGWGLPGFGDGTEPSELLDPGEWLLMADAFLADVPDLPAELTEERRREVRGEIELAVAATQEAMKFLREGEDEISAFALWSQVGYLFYEAHWPHFQREWLEGQLDRCRYLLELLDEPPAGRVG